MRWLVRVWVLAGCGGSGSDTSTADSGADEVQTIVLRSAGTACLFGGAVPGSSESDTSFTADAPISARAVLEDCASGCAEAITASCEIRLVGDEVVVDADASYEIPTGDASCVSMCVEIAATCEGDGLAAGDWTLDYDGGHSDTFAVPGTVAPPCATSLQPPR